MTIAIRIARAFTGRDKIAFCGYHGWHDWYLAANLGTKNALGEHLISGLDPAGVPKGLAGTSFPFRYNHIDELNEILHNNQNEIAAIVMEPIRNQEPETGFLDEVRKLTDEHRAVLIVDEISAGFRLNTGGAHLTLGMKPDMAVFSKALGNGYPIAAIIGKAEIMEAAQKTFISSTAWTERIGPVAAIATINKHRQCDVGRHLVLIGQLIQEGWRTMSRKHDLSISVGGIPPLSNFTFLGEHSLVLKTLFIQWMLEKGFLATTGFYSMYAHKKEHVDAYLDAVDYVFGKIQAAIAKGNPEKHLLGNLAVTGFKRLN
jgi:glutamate-1-semialdehyde 2,1-aminomutase